MTIKLFNNAAEKQKAYRRRLREAGKSADGRERIERLEEWRVDNPSSKKKKNAEKRFVAIDTEGINRKGEHLCCLLGDSQGGYVENYKDGLASHQAFEFLLDCAKGKTIVVGFSIGYDVNMILRDCSDVTLQRLASGLKATQQFDNGRTYLIEWLPGKSFYVAHLGENRSIVRSVLVYDTFGFFQKAFVKTAREFDVITKEEDVFLSEMKADRSAFKEKDKQKIREYNLLECRVLVRIMDLLRDAMKVANCVPERWNGAGAIAAKLMRDHSIKERNYTPENMLPLFLGAYFGGRIQILQMGEHYDLFTHDIISAYPAAMMELPSSVGEWKRTKTFKPKEKFALYVVEWNLSKDTLIAPFPFREDVKGAKLISYPLKGKGVYWFPEVDTAIKAYGDKIKVHYGYYFKPTELQIFDWIQELFEARKRFKLSKNPRERLANVPVKLGINSLYGKTVQGIGYKGMRPPYQNYFWGGWLTSKTRARMFKLAMQSPKEIIAFATDGVFSNIKLAENGEHLGEWEVDKADYLFILKAGLYAFGKGGDNLQTQLESSKSRGHFLKDVPFDLLRELWRKEGHYASYSYKTTKFFGLKISMAHNMDKWRKWLEVNRTINAFPSNQIPDDIETVERVKRIRSYPVSGSSLPYTPKGDWYEGDEGLAYLDELDQLHSFFDE